MSINGTIQGRVVAQPEERKISDKFSVLEFPVYSDRRVKNRDSGEYESDPKGTTKLKVVAKFDLKDNLIDQGITKGDVVTVTGSFYEREYDKKDGTKGRSLETDYIESVDFKYRAETKNDGFDDEDKPF